MQLARLVGDGEVCRSWCGDYDKVHALRLCKLQFALKHLLVASVQSLTRHPTPCTRDCDGGRIARPQFSTSRDPKKSSRRRVWLGALARLHSNGEDPSWIRCRLPQSLPCRTSAHLPAHEETKQRKQDPRRSSTSTPSLHLSRLWCRSALKIDRFAEPNP